MSAPSSFDTLHTALEEAADRDEFAGVVVVRRGAEHMFEGAYGPASRRWPVPVELHTRFDTASVTKAVSNRVCSSTGTGQRRDAGPYAPSNMCSAPRRTTTTPANSSRSAASSSAVCRVSNELGADMAQR